MAVWGSLLALSAPGFDGWILAWIALIPALLWVDSQTSIKQVAVGGFLLGFFFQGIYCCWFFDLHPLTWLGFTEWGSRLTTLAGWLLVAVEGGLIAAAVLTLYALYRLPWRWLFLPFIWVSGFWLLHTSPMAMPWGMLEYSQASLPMMRWLAGWLGASGLAFLLVLHNALWVSWLQRRQKPGFTCVGVLALPVLVWLLGFFPVFNRTEGHFPLPVAAIQANLPIELIRGGGLTEPEIEDAYLKPLRQESLPAGTLVVYPEEGVVPGHVFKNRPYQNPVFKRLDDIVRQKHVWIAVGVTLRDEAGDLYNSIALLGASSPPQFYQKRKLVPFGEFTPYGFGPCLERLLASWNVAYHAPFSPGKEAPLLRVGQIPIGGLVCFELIDAAPFSGGFAGDYKRLGAQLLLNISNLGWFHENPLMEAQFLAIGRLRAAENRLPLVIASNTGISAIISANGDVLARTQPFAAGSGHAQIIRYP